MWQISVTFGLSIFLAFVPYLGVPIKYKLWFVTLCAVFMAFLIYFIRKELLILRHTVLADREVVTDMYVENNLKNTPALVATVVEIKKEESGN